MHSDIDNGLKTPSRSPDLSIPPYKFWWPEMLMGYGITVTYKIVYDNGYIWWVDRAGQKRMTTSALHPHLQQTIARSYREYINGLIMGDPLMVGVYVPRYDKRK